MEVQNICDILIETYNVNKFDSAATDLKDAVYKEAQRCSTTYPMKIYENKIDTFPIRENNRDILMKLVNNHFDPSIQQPMPKFISGPTTLTVHKSPDEKRMVYIFGEWHTGIKDCKMFQYEDDEKWNSDNPDKMTIDHFLYELMKTTSAYLDIYFEFPSFKKIMLGYYLDLTIGEVNDHLYNLFEKFKKCINKFESRSKDDCSLARVHYFDSRITYLGGWFEGSTILEELVEKVAHLKRKYGTNLAILNTEYIYVVETDKKVIEVLNALASDNEQDFTDFWKKQLSDNELNIKETKSGKYQDRGTIEEIETMNTIKSFMEREIVRKAMMYREKYIELVNKIFRESKQGGHIQIFYNAFEDLIQYIIKTSARSADLYLLARLFKDFDMTKMKTHANYDLTDQPDKAYNVIIYAGDSHAEIYRRYLKEIGGFEEIASTGKSEINEGDEIKHCINMRRIPQPFFSTWTQTPTKEEEEQSYISELST